MRWRSLLPFDWRAIYPFGSAAGKGATVRTAAGFRSDAFGTTNTTGVLIAVFCSALAVSIGGAPAAAAPGPDQAKLKKQGKLERLRELRRQREAEAPERDPDLHR